MGVPQNAHRAQFRTAEDYRDHLPCEKCEPVKKDPRYEWNDYDDEGLKGLKRRLFAVEAEMKQIEQLQAEKNRLLRAIEAYNGGDKP